MEPTDWASQQAEHEAAIAAGAGGDAYQGLAMALFWQNDVNGALRAMEAAYVHYRRETDHGRAAWAAFWLGAQYLRYKGNRAAASGWIGTSYRLTRQAEPSAHTGRILLMKALATGDAAEIERAADQAMELARRFGDPDYEALALAYGGLAILSMGRLKEGLARLDGAMASTTAGEVRAPEAVGQIYCALLAGCERTADFRRADEWRDVAQPFLDAYSQVGMTGTCRATYAGVLAATGKWSEAEHELLEALRIFDAGPKGMRADALVRLADLRVRQGRLDEAARLLEGNETHPDAQQPLAELELARGRPKVAAALLERRVNQLGEANLQAGPMLLQLTEARIAAGEVAAARAAAEALAKLAATSGGDHMHGLARLASAFVTSASGGDPVVELDLAFECLQQAQMTWEATRARLAIAEAVATRNPELAKREARLALATFRSLGAAPGADRAGSLLRDLGVRTPGGPAATAGLSRREQDVARLVGLGLSNDQIAARLYLSPRTVEHHVTSILRKLSASRRVEIAAYAVRHLGAGPGTESG
ncbi:MAG TPA: LuxR C-terminal-related transcriptional regulator [Candidatus Dormibacteraeota bacterium]